MTNQNPQMDLMILIVILVINLIIAVVYLVLHLFRKKDRKQGFIVFVYLLVFPIVGVAAICLGELLSFLIRLISGKELDPKDLSFSKERMHLLSDADIEQSLNTVAVDEALLVSNTADKRESFINLLKDDEADVASSSTSL